MAPTTTALQPPSCVRVRMRVHQHGKLQDHRLSWGLVWHSIRKRPCVACPSDHPARASTRQTKPTHSKDRRRRILRVCTSVFVKSTRQTMLPIPHQPQERQRILFEKDIVRIARAIKLREQVQLGLNQHIARTITVAPSVRARVFRSTQRVKPCFQSPSAARAAAHSIRTRHCADCPNDNAARTSTTLTEPAPNRDHHRRIVRACTSVSGSPKTQN